ncbi:helix-turn-helix domain-containing protein [Salmonella enterica subsp. enterica]|uniref:transcriptional regulator n=1 Tax=Salmonella enterica TaxID=28901 RepID=UPI0010780D09|nr:helix-turn-helix domain-containing protein [Salmonella enterica subsp. enterica]EAO9719051.1 helix-turn-helix domain-containing protein [Salmonella enterica]EBF8123596.1 helix-turn-helix domain-containing protein [Salmonella enterica subsp. enterica serovar Aba]EBU7766958.1 transcriptional regulator [Salmonella enterica subsp. enterica serovar Rovaniemi]ECT8306752.1 helix-turn-helix domain-containing protein [Salmonella enterica subsp. enterica serovar Llandoff]EEI6239117.1 helix-turn-helix
MDDAVKRAVAHVGSQSKLGRKLGYSQTSVYKWLNGMRKVPPEAVPKIVELTGGRVQAHELRPDLPQLFPPPEQ